MPSTNIQISDQEAELYDRQIRLWGVDAQNRLRNASVMIIGFDGVGVEAAKNIMLTGVRKLTIVDSRKIGDETQLMNANFFIDSADSDEYIVVASQTRCAKLNPNVELKVLTSKPMDLCENAIKQANFILLAGQPDDVLRRVSKIARANKILYIIAEAYGFYGATFSDFGEKHAYRCELKIDECAVTDDVAIVPPSETICVDAETESQGKVSNVDSQPEEKRRRTAEHHEIEAQETHKLEEFESLDTAFYQLLTDAAKEGSANIKERRRKIPIALYIVHAMRKYITAGGDTSHVDLLTFEEHWNNVLSTNGLQPSNLGLLPCDFVWSLYGQLTPTCAVIGGIVSQELVKGISLKDKPYNNTFVYDGRQNHATVVHLPSNSA